MVRRRWAALVLCMTLAACAALDGRRGEALADRDSNERKILVMLHLAPPHFRPDTAYTRSYDSRFGRDDRRRIADALAREHNLRLISDWPMPALGVECFVMEVQPTDSPARRIEQLALDPRVESAQPMHVFQALGHNDPLYPLQPSGKLWHLAEIHESVTGKNVVVAEIDTGVEVEHPDLRGLIAAARNFVDCSPYSAEMHGTALAGSIAARDDDGIGIAGVAPQARLLALRACWQEPRSGSAAFCSSFTLAKALQFALEQKARVINLSLAGPHDRLLERLLNAALAQGTTIVSAADPAVIGGGFPASSPGVLAVAEEDTRDDSAALLLAPGRDIPTTALGSRWDFVTGSSYSAAHVTGLVALLYELAPSIQPRQISDALRAGTLPRLAANRPVMIDACAAIARATGTHACASAVTRQAKSLPGQ